MQLQALLERNQLLQVTRTLMKFWVKLHSPLKSETVNTVETFLCSPSPTEKRKKKHVCNFVKAHLPLVNDASCTSSLFLGRKNTKQDTVTQTGQQELTSLVWRHALPPRRYIPLSFGTARHTCYHVILIHNISNQHQLSIQILQLACHKNTTDVEIASLFETRGNRE